MTGTLESPTSQDLTPDQLLDAYRTMKTIREFEERVHDEFAGGAYALFDPGQQTHLFSHILAPEGRLFFAGEHASLAHGWIQGAIESGLRAAIEVAR